LPSISADSSCGIRTIFTQSSPAITLSKPNTPLHHVHNNPEITKKLRILLEPRYLQQLPLLQWEPSVYTSAPMGAECLHHVTQHICCSPCNLVGVSHNHLPWIRVEGFVSGSGGNTVLGIYCQITTAFRAVRRF